MVVTASRLIVSSRIPVARRRLIGSLHTSASRRPPLLRCPLLSSSFLSLAPSHLLRHSFNNQTANSRATLGPTAAYNEQVAHGIIQNDEYQRGIVQLLQKMYDQLENYSPAPVPAPAPPPPPPTLYERLFKDPPPKHSIIPPIPEDVPKGLYLYGSVGCGKSFLMDLFYANLPAKFEHSKRRVHFHAFMMDVHQRGHRMKSLLHPEQDWIVHVAGDLAREARVLCFDEFQVTDIADAMILRRLMESLMAYGVVAVMTSNRAPNELYKNGIQREQFLPCIELIKSRFIVHSLDSDIDYRKRPRALSKVYFHPINSETTAEVDKLFDALAPAEDVMVNRPVTVWGRNVPVPLSTSSVAKFTFEELCGKNLSASDYLAITKQFQTVFVTDVPQLDLNSKDMARRFILFIDSAYEAKTKLFILSEPPISEIFSDKNASGPHVISDHQRSVMDDLGLSAEKVGASTIFTGEEEIFAFARAVSRITEMGGVQWSRQSKGPGPKLEDKVVKTDHII